jgi:hypothetical protein
MTTGGLAASMEARTRRWAGLCHPWRCELAVFVVGAKATTEDSVRASSA